MSILLPLYLRISKKRFHRPFEPLKIEKKPLHLVSTPVDPAEFFRAVPFLSGLSKIGNVVLLMSKNLQFIRSFMKTKQFEIIIYEKHPRLFSEDFKRVGLQLGDRHFHFLIELNNPANVSLPYLRDFKRRIAFYDNINYPYYNILVRDGYTSLNQFFGVEVEDAHNMFHFQSRELKTLAKRLGKKHPMIFINEAADMEWKGDQIILGKDILPEDPEVWKAVYMADAYSGKEDGFYEFAMLNKKTLVTK